MIDLKTRLYNAVMAADPEKRGYVLRLVTEDVSFQDFLTDLAPFIEAEIQQARREAFTEAAHAALDARPYGLRDATLEALAKKLLAMGEKVER